MNLRVRCVHSWTQLNENAQSFRSPMAVHETQTPHWNVLHALDSIDLMKDNLKATNFGE